MKAPKSVIKNESTISAELIAERDRVRGDYFYNKEIDDDEANKAIDAFNKRWLEAGGIEATTLCRRHP